MIKIKNIKVRTLIFALIILQVLFLNLKSFDIDISKWIILLPSLIFLGIVLIFFVVYFFLTKFYGNKTKHNNK